MWAPHCSSRVMKSPETVAMSRLAAAPGTSQDDHRTTSAFEVDPPHCAASEWTSCPDHLAVLVGCLVLVMVSRCSAGAHASLVSDQPGGRVAVATAPPTVALTFSEDVESGFVAVTAPDGTKVTTSSRARRRHDDGRPRAERPARPLHGGLPRRLGRRPSRPGQFTFTATDRSTRRRTDSTRRRPRSRSSTATARSSSSVSPLAVLAIGADAGATDATDDAKRDTFRRASSWPASSSVSSSWSPPSRSAAAPRDRARPASPTRDCSWAGRCPPPPT